MQDELANLISQNLNLNNTVHYQQPPELPPTPQPEAPSQITYISQHYHHSAHQVPPVPSDEELLQYQLGEHGIDSKALLPTQIQLYRGASLAQKLRLIELWSIVPSTRDNQTLVKDLKNWQQTSMEQEELAAKARHARRAAESQHLCHEHRHHAEPYMSQGYSQPGSNDIDALNLETTRASEYHRALDPVYHSREWWRHESDPLHQHLGPPDGRQDEDEQMT